MNLPMIDDAIAEVMTSITTLENEMIQEALDILDRRLFTTHPVLDSATAVAPYLKLKLAAEEHEVFAAVFLNAKHQPLAFEVLFKGTIDTATVHPRQLVKRAMAHNAAALIISHNHPSGCREPSLADINLTKRLKEALQLIDVRLLDHFIVGSGMPYSLAERGLI